MGRRLAIVGDTDRLFPVQAFFNAMGDSVFLRILADLVSGVGAGVNDVHCEFPGDLNEDEEPFEGIRFSLYEDEVVVDRDTFLRFLRLAAESYVREHPHDQAQVEAILGRIS